jgi:hypothetical protein
MNDEQLKECIELSGQTEIQWIQTAMSRIAELEEKLRKRVEGSITKDELRDELLRGGLLK